MSKFFIKLFYITNKIETILKLSYTFFRNSRLKIYIFFNLKVAVNSHYSCDLYRF